MLSWFRGWNTFCKKKIIKLFSNFVFKNKIMSQVLSPSEVLNPKALCNFWTNRNFHKNMNLIPQATCPSRRVNAAVLKKLDSASSWGHTLSWCKSIACLTFSSMLSCSTQKFSTFTNTFQDQNLKSLAVSKKKWFWQIMNENWNSLRDKNI